MSHQYVIGVDFGTQSARAVLADAHDGTEYTHAVAEYPHGVCETVFPPTGQELGQAWALQAPADYLVVLRALVNSLLTAGYDPDAVVGIGVDATSCTVLPTTADGTPLALLDQFAREPHAWAKMWKHHAAQPHADRINRVFAEQHPELLVPYGGRYSCELLLPKAMEVLQEAPAVWNAAARFIELHDWVVWQLCGVERRSAQAAGSKGSFIPSQGGYPSAEILESLMPGLSSLTAKLSTDVNPPGTRAGGLTRQMAADLGLPAGIAVAVGHQDGFAAAIAVGAFKAGRMALVTGTSVNDILLSVEEPNVEGMNLAVKDALIPGLWTVEAGQSGVGDMFGWFVRNQVPQAYEAAADAAGKSVYEYLESLAAPLQPGQTGLIALDWWNGNRSVLNDGGLSGLIVGLTLGTRPEHLYRALIEAAAFGQRVIIDAFERSGLPVTEIVACGGLAQRSPLYLQTLADVTRRTLRVSATIESAALGAALHASVAAGYHASIAEAGERFERYDERVYTPDETKAQAYHAVYADYLHLHDVFGCANPEFMHRLGARARAKSAEA